MSYEQLQLFDNMNILVAGDLMIDKYVSGDVERISPEAPIPVLCENGIQEKLGGAGNTVNNIRALSAQCRVVSFVGDDGDGETLIRMLRESGADAHFVFSDESMSTCVKTRIVARKQQVIRIDREQIKPASDRFKSFLKEHLDDIFEGINALILSDYGKGMLTPEITKLLLEKARGLGIPVLVDPKGTDWDKYSGASMVTPNLKEFSEACGEKIGQQDEEKIQSHAYELCRKYNLDYLLVTRSERGMSLISRDGVKSDYAARQQDVTDISGAGDTVISVMALSLAAGFDAGRGCSLANEAAGVVVSKFGTSTVSKDELIGAEIHDVGKKRLTMKDAEYLFRFLNEKRKRIVFTNGCFDLVHAGHIYSLETARSFGDILVVGLNSDDSIRRLKGPKRPVISQEDRAYLLQSLEFVDYVIVFDEDTPEELIRCIVPDVLVKGSDYKDKQVVGREIVEAAGGRVELVDLRTGLSTSNIISQILTVYGEE